MGKYSSSAFRRRLLMIIASFLMLCLMIIGSSTPVEATVNSHEWNWIPTGKGECRGSIGECMDATGEGEFEMDSEINRRILATTTKYISYGALQADTVPCSIKGASYYNCRVGAQANPYSRGCSAITRCRS